MSASNEPPPPATSLSGMRALVTESHGWVQAIAVIGVALFITAGALSKSELIGRLSFPATHNDIAYLLDGIRRLVYMDVNGFWAEFNHLRLEPLHAPVAAYQAALAFYLFGFHDWAPYLTNIVFLFILLFACTRLLRGCPDLVVIACLLAVAGVPLAFSTITEFAPETPLGLFSALGVLLAVRIPLNERAVAVRFVAGLLFGFGFLAKPSSLAFIPIVVCATIGLTFLRDIVFAGRWRQWTAAIGNGVLGLLSALWLPALYIVPNFTEFYHYFYTALFDKANVTAYGYYPDFRTNVLYFFSGAASEFMFGDFLWCYITLIAAGLFFAIRRGDKLFINRQMELLVVGFLMWLMPTVSLAKNILFGAPFGFLLIFMVMMALRSIFDSLPRITGTSVVFALGLFLMVSGTSRHGYPNTPGFEWTDSSPVSQAMPTIPPRPHVIREAWVETQDRLRAVMLGNSPNYYGRFVYLTNGGYYNNANMDYWFLKNDVTLDWKFQGLWFDSNVDHHLSVIRQNKADFVIAAEHGNGLTYAPGLIAGAGGVENALLAAMWEDPHYTPIDRFYGPTGRTITIFQRSTAFAGWHLMAGLYQSLGVDSPWISRGTISHLGSYAPADIKGRLTLNADGDPGQTVEIYLNMNKIGQFTFDGTRKAIFDQPCDLVRGENDIVLRYSVDAPVTFTRLTVVREIGRDF